MNSSEAAPVLQPGQVITLRIAALTPTGAGISKDFGRPVFVERVAPGDLAEVELFDVRKDFAKGKILRLIESSRARAQPPCPIFNVCGGCQWQHMSYDAQLNAKTDIVKQSVRHIGHCDDSIVKPTLAAPEPLHYRNKVQFPARNPKGSQRILAGYFKQNSHELINVKYCPVQPAALDDVLSTVKAVLERHGIWAYNEKTGKGTLRHINARHSFASGRILVTLVVNMRARTHDEFIGSPLGKRLQQSAQEIMELDANTAGVCVNLNSEPGNRILGEVTLRLAGDSYIEETLRTQRDDFPKPLKEGLRFRLSSTSFFQINTRQAVRLLEVVYDQALSLLAQVEHPVIVDAFAGVGTMAFWLSPVAARVIAIEEHADAVADGKLNADNNRISNVEFVHGSVETILPRLLEQGVKPDLVVLDPPRKGLSAEAIQSLLKLDVPNLVYVSCNPATLARDLKILGQGRETEPNLPSMGYKTRQIQPVDLFPQTYHVESVSTLTRQASDGSLRNLEET